MLKKFYSAFMKVDKKIIIVKSKHVTYFELSPKEFVIRLFVLHIGFEVWHRYSCRRGPRQGRKLVINFLSGFFCFVDIRAVHIVVCVCLVF